MSAQAEKVLRRDLRRAMGAEAIGVIDHNAKLLAALQKELARTYELVAFQGRSIVKLRAEVDGHVRWHHEQAARTFGQRLRWLVTGR